MKQAESTFDKLVQNISTSEARNMLESIKQNIAASSYVFEEQQPKSPISYTEAALGQVNVSQESFFVRLILSIVSFFKSTPIQVVYNDYLLKKLAKELHRIARLYYITSSSTFTSNFYQSLKELRKTQLFFSGLLQAYDSEKGEFYIILSSFIAPNVYEALLKKTDPFNYTISPDASINTRANYAKEVDSLITQLSEEQKGELYTCAKAIEWIKMLCDVSLDKALLKFSGSENDATCSAPTILSEMQILTSVLHSARHIPDEVLQTLFLLHQKESIAINSTELDTETDQFKENAVNALKSISQFVSIIPMVSILRYVGRDITWQPLRLESGEDWFIFFKHAWKERLSNKWDAFTAEQEKVKLRNKMCSVLEVEDLQKLSYEPWENFNLEYIFSKKLTMEFLKTFFTQIYVPHISPVLNVILVNGKFLRRENSTEFMEAFSQMQQFADMIRTFEEMLAPAGELGEGFEKLREEKVIGLTFKKNFDMLTKGLETNAHQIITACTKAVRSLYAILTGIISNNKKGLYSTLSNINTINGNKTDEYMEKLKKAYDQISQLLLILEHLAKIEK